MQYIKKICLYGFMLALSLMLWGFVIEPSRVVYKEHQVFIKNWPSELSGYTIALLTDLHVGSPHITIEKLADIVTNTNARKPDLILLGGDYVIQGVLGGNAVSSNEIVNALTKLHATDGVYGVLGNHDWWDSSTRILNEFKQAGIPMLEDNATHITTHNTGFWLVGISDYNEGAHDVQKALKNIPNDAPRIALTHSPDIFPELPNTLPLTIAGHTHGGQVYIPLLGRPIVPSQYGSRYALGLIKEGEKQIFVGAGIGTSILPVRFLTPPEVSFLRIYPEKVSQ